MHLSKADYLGTLRYLGLSEQSDLLFTMPKCVKPRSEFVTSFYDAASKRTPVIMVTVISVSKIKASKCRLETPYVTLAVRDYFGNKAFANIFSENIGLARNLSSGEKIGISGKLHYTEQVIMINQPEIFAEDQFGCGVLANYGHRKFNGGIIKSHQTAYKVARAISDPSVMTDAITRLCSALNCSEEEFIEKIKLGECFETNQISKWVAALHAPSTYREWNACKRKQGQFVRLERDVIKAFPGKEPLFSVLPPSPILN